MLPDIGLESPTNMRLLMVEDEESLARPIIRGLEEEGYRVDLAMDGEQGERMALARSYDLLIVDWRLPRMDGRTLVGRLRRVGLGTPILMLTALRDVDHRIAGLDAGADDYLTKPFSFEELLARLRALLRRVAQQTEPGGHQRIHLDAGPVHLDTSRRSVTFNDEPIDLRTKEYLLLELLMRRAGAVVSRTVIAERVWGSAHDVTDNAIDVTVSGIRQRLTEAARGGSPGVVLETVRGVGYRLLEHL